MPLENRLKTPDFANIDAHSNVAFVRPYDRGNALVAADLLNNRVAPFFDQQDVPSLRILPDSATESCRCREHNRYQSYLTLEDIDHSKTGANTPQSNSIRQWFHKMVLDEFYPLTFRKKLHNTLDKLQEDSDIWLRHCHEERVHSGRYCFEELRCKRSGIQYNW